MARSIIRKNNWSLILPAIALTLLGLLSIYSSSSFFSFKKQVLFFFLSILFLILFNFFDITFLKKNSYLILILYFFSILSLLGLLFFADKIRGVRGWYNLGSFSLDPVPLSAIILIVVLSKYFSVRHIETERFKPILFSMVYLLIPVFLILLQPDLGSSIILVFVWLGMVIFSGIRFRHLLVLFLIFLIIAGASWFLWLKDYQKERIITFLKPGIDPEGISWNSDQSKIAIGSGGFWGKGIDKGSQTQYNFLPESKTDFIFSALAEETGFLGIFILLSLIGFLLWQVIKISFRSDNNFDKLFAAGFAFLILSQSLINIGMCLGLLPIIGIPLPFVSYGGSQLISFYLGIAIISSTSRNA